MHIFFLSVYLSLVVHENILHILLLKDWLDSFPFVTGMCFHRFIIGST